MSLSPQDIERLTHLIGMTRDEEVDCDRCLALVAEFAERKLSDQSISESLKLVEHHLEICDECREEFHALQRSLAHLSDD